MSARALSWRLARLSMLSEGRGQSVEPRANGSLGTELGRRTRAQVSRT
jgi:hypothetical protein